jgi:hypothetical protein
MITHGEGDDQYIEGELNYHARTKEGGACAFILPSTGEIWLIDEGRVCSRKSFYRNKVGEVYEKYSETKKNKWNSYRVTQETGGLDSLK